MARYAGGLHSTWQDPKRQHITDARILAEPAQFAAGLLPLDVTGRSASRFRALCLFHTNRRHGRAYRVVGLVRNAAYLDLRDPPEPEMFVPMSQTAVQARSDRYDPRSFATACAVVAIVALGAGYLPARRAANLDPISALRQK